MNNRATLNLILIKKIHISSFMRQFKVHKIVIHEWIIDKEKKTRISRRSRGRHKINDDKACRRIKNNIRKDKRWTLTKRDPVATRGLVNLILEEERFAMIPSSHSLSSPRPSNPPSMLHLLIYSYSRARYARSLRMLIFTFRLHGLIEVTPCGNIAGAMALNRGARPISPLSFCLHDNRSCTLFLSMFPILFFFPYFASTVSLSPTFFSLLPFLSLPLSTR